MSANTYRGQLERKRRQRLEAEKKAGEYRIKESNKRAEAGKARVAATKASNANTVQNKLREAERREADAATAGKEANRWQQRASGFAQDEARLAENLAKAESSERAEAERRAKRAQLQLDRQSAAQRASVEQRLSRAEDTANLAIRQLRPPRMEKLRVLILGASSEGDLRVGREQKRIRAAVESALHRDQIELDVRPAATSSDLLDGIVKFRPHVVHFSGHGGSDLIVFEDELDEPHSGVAVTANAFAAAIRATDDPPVLVLLNSCESAHHIDSLVQELVPFAIGMADEIEDGDAINYAAQFYSAVANGQSVQSAHLSGQAALELAGLESAELPTLASAPGFDPATTLLVASSA